MPIFATEILRNIIKQPLLRYTLLLTCMMALFMPVYTLSYVFPQFDHQLTRYAEDAAVRVATHLKKTLFLKTGALTEASFSTEVRTEFFNLMEDLRIEKIKVFSDTGKVLFSSDPGDIGTTNRHDYFHTLIAFGNTYSKVVKKNTPTMENRVVRTEVVESYIPLMQEGRFKGAVEVYYDIAENSTALTGLLNKLRLVILLFSISVPMILILILFKASRNILIKKQMDAALQETHKRLEQTVAERTEDLKQINLSLLDKIEAHCRTEESLQRSYDTQTVINRLLKESLGEASAREVMESALDLVLSLPWLTFESTGCIFLVEREMLVMKVHRGFSRDLEDICRTIPLGKCLCGRAAQDQQTVFASHIDDRHDILLPDTPDHGHYCIPMIAKGRTLGVINIYVKPGHEQTDFEENFLKSVANTLAGILIQRDADQEKREIQKRLAQSQKMEAIGTLAGGIAHDFNNILSGIFGHVQLAEMNLDTPDKAAPHLAQVRTGASRATDLIQQILTFTRQTEHRKHPVKLYLIVKEAVKFLKSSIPADVSITADISSKAVVAADPTQIHQIIMNLCTNAYQSMKTSGGTISVRLSETRIEENGSHGLTPGNYLKLCVADNGPGMPRDILQKIFEPYFTTKTVSEGTGLGLSVVHGIVEEHEGRIRVESEPGQGSVFTIYLPVLRKKTGFRAPELEKPPAQGGNERIMLVDDEENIVEYLTEFLESYGYHVDGYLEALPALEAFKKNPDAFDIVLTDMTMPFMTGDVLTGKILAIKRDIPIILCTGHSNRITPEQALDIGVAKFLQKPIQGMDLLYAIRETIKPDSMPG